MAEIDSEIHLKIKAVEFALDSFADYENKEKERRTFLRQHFEANPHLKTYLEFSVERLQVEKKQLQDERSRSLRPRFLRQHDVEAFLWDEPRPAERNDKLFPENGVGKYLLSRRSVVKLVMASVHERLKSHPEGSPSVYIHGCHGMGKTTCLHLIGKELKKEGYEVYYFPTVEEVPPFTGSQFVSMAKEEEEKVAVLIDEADGFNRTGIFTRLLKSGAPNLVTIGAAVPRYLRTTHTGNFKELLQPSDLLLKESDEDFRDLVKFWEDTKATTREMTMFICKLLLEHCGGHIYPTLAFMEYFFTEKEASKDSRMESQQQKRKALESKLEFERFFFSEEFAESASYRRVTERCFDRLDPQTKTVAIRVLRGQAMTGDVEELTRCGWWNADNKQLVSALLVNSCLKDFKSERSEDAKSLVQPQAVFISTAPKEAVAMAAAGAGCMPDEHTELVIAEGLSAMEEIDFSPSQWRHWMGQLRLQDTVSFNWALHVRRNIPDAHIQYQALGVDGRVKFYLGGIADCAIEVLLDAKQDGTSQDVNKHLSRLLNGAYPRKRFALLNFAMTHDVVLPRKKTWKGMDIGNRVYTYVHLTNTLYRGNVPIRAPAVLSLKCSNPLYSVRKYSTVAGMRFEAGGLGLVVKRLLKFL